MKNPCSGEKSTSSACGAVHVIFRETRRDGPKCPLSALYARSWGRKPSANAASPASSAPAFFRGCCPFARAQSTAGPTAKKASCSLTIAISAAEAPSSARPFADHSLPHVHPHADEQRDGKRRTGVRVRWRRVHVKEERGTHPHGDPREDTHADDPARDGNREQDREKPVARRPVRHRHDVGLRETVRRHVHAGDAGEPRRHIGDRVKRRPQDRAAECRKAHTASRRRLGLEERLLEALRSRDATLIEVPVFVLEGDVVVEPERAQVRKVLDFVRGIEPGGDGRQRQQKQRHEPGQLATRQTPHGVDLTSPPASRTSRAAPD